MSFPFYDGGITFFFPSTPVLKVSHDYFFPRLLFLFHWAEVVDA